MRKLLLDKTIAFEQKIKQYYFIQKYCNWLFAVETDSMGQRCKKGHYVNLYVLTKYVIWLNGLFYTTYPLNLYSF